LLFPYQANRGDTDELYVDKNGDLVIVEVEAGPTVSEARDGKTNQSNRS
jgi:hypothetical protein